MLKKVFQKFKEWNKGDGTCILTFKNKDAFYRFMGMIYKIPELEKRIKELEEKTEV